MPQERVCECGRIMTVADEAFEGRLRCPRCGREIVFLGAAAPPTLDIPLAVEPPAPPADALSAAGAEQGDEGTIAVAPMPPKEETPDGAPAVSETPVADADEVPVPWWSLLLRLPITPMAQAPHIAERLVSPAAVGRACAFMAGSVPVTMVFMGVWLNRSRTGPGVIVGAIAAGGLYRLLSLAAQALVAHRIAWRTTGAGDFSRAVGALALLNGMVGWLSAVLIPVAAIRGWSGVWATRLLALVLYALFVRAGEPLLALVYEAKDERFYVVPLVCASIDAVLGFVLAPLVFGMPLT